MFSLETARDLVTPTSWLASIDLKNAYYTVPIYKPQKIPMVCLGQRTVRVHVHAKWIGMLPPNFYSDLKTIFSPYGT